MAWVAEEDFDSYTNGNDLNGKSGGSGWSAAWSGGTAFDISNAQSYDSPNSCITTNADQNISRSLTSATTSGTLYFAVKCTAMASDFQVDFKVGASAAFRFSFRNTDNIEILGAVTTVYNSAFSTSLWYLWEVVYNGTTADIRIHDGTSWGATSSALAYGTTGDVTQIAFNGGASQTCYVDKITATNPLVSAAVPSMATLGVGA